MTWTRIDVLTLPGLDPHRRDVLELAPSGTTVVVGPNASGKSSLVRAVRCVVDPTFDRDAVVDVDVTLAWDGATWVGSRRGSRVTWTRDGQPSPPPPLPDGRFFSSWSLDLESLARLDAVADGEIVDRIRRDLAGGYDLKAVQTSLGFDVKPPRSRNKRLQDVYEAWKAAQLEATQLALSDQRLDTWRARLADARAAAAKAKAVDALLEVSRLRSEAREAATVLAAFPEGMASIDGNALATLATHVTAWREGHDAAATAAEWAKEADQAASALDLPVATIDDDVLDAIADDVGACETLHQRVLEARSKAAVADAGLDQALDDLGREGRTVTPDLSPNAVARADDALDRWRSATAAADAAKAAVDLLEGDVRRTGDRIAGSDLRTSYRHRDVLATWLRTPPLDPRPSRVHGGRDVAVTVASALAAALSGWLAWTAEDSTLRWLALASSLAGVVAATLSAWNRTRRATRRRDAGVQDARSHDPDDRAARDLDAIGVRPPEAWTRDAVSAALNDLDAHLALAERHAELVRELDAATLRVDAATLAVDERADALRDLAREIGFGPLTIGAGVQRWIHLLDRRDRAAADAAAARGGRDEASEILLRHRNAIVATVATHGGSLPPAALEVLHDVTVSTFETIVRSKVQQWRDQLRRRREHLGSADGHRATEREARRQVARAVTDLHDLARRTSCPLDVNDDASMTGDDVARLETHVRTRVDLLGAYRQAADADLHARTAVSLATARLTTALEAAGDVGDEGDVGDVGNVADLGDALVTFGDDGPRPAASDTELQRLLAELTATASEAEALQETITAHQTRVQVARSQERIGRASAAWEAERTRLEQARDEALHAAAGRFMLAAVEREHERTSKPEVLREAERTFARFTRHAFELRFDDGDFHAWDTKLGQRRSLVDLSSATKTQVALAVRVAFARSLEANHVRTPFFLDEALTTSDPDRFGVVVAALEDAAAEDGRQLVYLSARMDDAVAWQNASRGACTIQTWPPGAPPLPRVHARALAVPEPELPPAPGDDAPEVYGTRLRVPPIDPWRDPDHVHPFHLMRDDLDTVHALLRVQVVTIGVARTWLTSSRLGDDLAATWGVTSTSLDLLARRMDATRAWLETWRIGRGRPVDRSILQASPLARTKFLDDASALVEAEAGSAQALLDAIDGKKFPGFRRTVRDELADWLVEHGHLDERAVLTPAERVARIASTLATSGADTGPDDVRAWWALDAALEAGVAWDPTASPATALDDDVLDDQRMVNGS